MWKVAAIANIRRFNVARDFGNWLRRLALLRTFGAALRDYAALVWARIGLLLADGW